MYHMDLKTYLESNGIKGKFFADKLGINQSTLSRILTGTAKASASVALLIERVTNGAVSRFEVPISAGTKAKLIKTFEVERRGKEKTD